MLYEIINMSDPYTIEAQSLDVAVVACLFLGGGQYAFQPLTDGGIEIPMFMFGGADEWCQKQFGRSLEGTVENVNANKAVELADCFDSCLIGGRADRETYRSGLELIDDPEKRDKWRIKWLDDRRSSMNNIGARAYAIAKKIRDGQSNPLKGNTAPQQVFAR